MRFQAFAQLVLSLEKAGLSQMLNGVSVTTHSCVELFTSDEQSSF